MKPISEFKQKIEHIITHHTQIFVEIRGREAVLAEGYCRIGQYTDSIIHLESDIGKIAVRGKALQLRHLSDERVAIEGRIDAVEFL